MEIKLEKNALIADDDEFFRMALSEILKSQLGFSSVSQVGSFDSAMELIGEISNLDLAAFDLTMPGITSAISLSAVRECAPSIKVVVISGSTSRQDMLLSLEAGVHGYIPKNLGVPELSRALKLVMTGGIFVPPSIAEIELVTMRKRIQPAPVGLELLTVRQLEVLKYLVEGQSNKEIARHLTLGEGTIKIHVAAIFRGLGVSNRAAAAVVGSTLLGKSS